MIETTSPRPASWRAAAGLLDQATQPADRALAGHAAIEAQQILEPALREHHGEMGGAQQREQPQILVADRPIDDPPLQLERHHGERKDHGRQQA